MSWSWKLIYCIFFKSLHNQTNLISKKGGWHFSLNIFVSPATILIVKNFSVEVLALKIKIDQWELRSFITKAVFETSPVAKPKDKWNKTVAKKKISIIISNTLLWKNCSIRWNKMNFLPIHRFKPACFFIGIFIGIHHRTNCFPVSNIHLCIDIRFRFYISTSFLKNRLSFFSHIVTFKKSRR